MLDTDKARINKEKAEKKQVEIEAMRKQIDERTSKVEKELSTVVPRMEAAKKAISSISSKSLAQLKALKAPHPKLKTALKLSAIIYYKVAH